MLHSGHLYEGSHRDFTPGVLGSARKQSPSINRDQMHPGQRFPLVPASVYVAVRTPLSECASRCALRASDVRMPTLGCTEARHPHARVGVRHTGPPLHICALPHLRLVHLTMNTLACLGCAQVHVPMRAHAGRPKTCGSLPSPANPPAAQFQAFSRLKGFNSLNCY